jgi:ABC-type protease/lipase transport system fused ATPase/permease subunit
MRGDIGEIIGLIAVSSGAILLCLSYVGAYMIGRTHGRREEERSRALDQMDTAQRIAAVEATVNGIHSAVDRLRDAQRLLVAQQDHLSRKVGLSSDRMAIPPAAGRHTPS